MPSDSRLLRVDDTLRDLRHAARTLVRHPSFAIAAVLSLALGIGPTVAIFSVLDAALLNPLPYAEPDRLVAIRGTSLKTTRNPLSYPNFLDLRSRVQTLEDIAAWHLEMFTLAGRVQAERLIGGRVSASYFSVLRTQPLLGRTFTATEDQIGGPPVALLGESLWRRAFAADPQVVGQTVTLDGRPHTVIGVMPAHVGVGVIPRLYNDVFLPIGQHDDPLFLSRHVNAWTRSAASVLAPDWRRRAPISRRSRGRSRRPIRRRTKGWGSASCLWKTTSWAICGRRSCSSRPLWRLSC